MAAEEAIVIALLGLMFWLLNFAGQLKVESENEKVVRLNLLLRYIFTLFAIIVGFFLVMLAYSLALENSYTEQVLVPVRTIYWLMIAFIPVVLYLVTYGTFINEFLAFWDWVLKNTGFNPERRRRKR